ncbi:hypothetical protein [Chitinophaga barathri]|uniref:Uncharacterized protein n=1 Tax=Chitinophaga barathri TaxID=1647451 RepID=A0A3N4MC69_9BACT|nr:hypothetical protein [Chitinophaga barathri]RPD39456.1 hypothetical protein EG028_20260 [Chitinophaga barathri]
MSTQTSGRQPYFRNIDNLQKLNRLDEAGQMRIMEQGFTPDDLAEFCDLADLDWIRACYALNISGMKIHRIMHQTFLPPETSKELFHLAQMYAQGYEFSNSRKRFNDWMTMERKYVRFLTPFVLLNSREGKAEANDML